MLFECFNINVAALHIIGISVIEFFGLRRLSAYCRFRSFEINPLQSNVQPLYNYRAACLKQAIANEQS